MIIERKEIKYHFNDCHPYLYILKLEEVTIMFYQLGSRDLQLVVQCKKIEKEVLLELKKDTLTTENKTVYLLYNLIDNLYQEIVIQKCMSEEEKNRDIPLVSKYPYGYLELVDNGIINWKSDAPIDELSNEFTYNYLTILKDKDKYILKFINNSNQQRFNIEFNTDRSRYGRFVYPFMILLNNLKTITDSYDQITIEEYLKNKKLIKRK